MSLGLLVEKHKTEHKEEIRRKDSFGGYLKPRPNVINDKPRPGRYMPELDEGDDVRKVPSNYKPTTGA